MKKQAQVVMLESFKNATLESIIFYPVTEMLKICDKDTLKFVNNKDFKLTEKHCYPVELYILSDDKIEECEYYCSPAGIISKHNGTEKLPDNWKKIISTTDKSLKIKSEQSGENAWFNPLPQIQQQFIELFITEYNKDNIITEVEVEYEEYLDTTHSDHGAYKTKILINKDNTINISLPVKNDIKEFVNINYSFFTEDTRNKMILGINGYLKENNL